MKICKLCGKNNEENIYPYHLECYKKNKYCPKCGKIKKYIEKPVCVNCMMIEINERKNKSIY